MWRLYLSNKPFPPAGDAEDVIEEGREENEQHQAVEPREYRHVARAHELVVGKESEDENRQHREGNLPPDGAFLHDEWHQEGSDAQDHEDVDDTAANYVSDDYLRVPLDLAHDADEELRRGGAERHDSEPHHEVTHAHAFSERGCAAHEPFGPLVEECEADY